MLNSQPTVKQIQLEKLILHHMVPEELRLAVGSVVYNQDYKEILSNEALLFLLTSHPPHVTINKKGIGACFAGLRLFQLAKSYLPPTTPISVLSHKNLAGQTIAEIATLDPYLTTLAYSLDNRSWPLEVTKVWSILQKETLKKYTPECVTKTKLSQQIKTNRRTLSPQSPVQESKLKAMATLTEPKENKQ